MTVLQARVALVAHAEPLEHVELSAHAAQPAPRMPEEQPVLLVRQALLEPPVLLEPGPEPMRTPPGVSLLISLLSLCSCSFPD